MEPDDVAELQLPIEGEETDFEVEGLWVGDIGASLYHLHAVYAATTIEMDDDPEFRDRVTEFLDVIEDNLSGGSSEGTAVYGDGGHAVLDLDLAESIREDFRGSLEERGILTAAIESPEEYVQRTDHPLYLTDANKRNPFDLVIVGLAVIALLGIALIAGTTIEAEGEGLSIGGWKLLFDGGKGMDALGDIPVQALKRALH